MERNLNWENQFKIFFEQEHLELSGCNIFIFREDGIPMYGVHKNLDRNTVGALMAGSWQAANALSGFIQGSREEIFRFSFDTSERGIYILPFSIKKTAFLLGVIFQGQVNPGLIKSKMRQMLERLLQHVEKIKEENPMPQREKFLFNEISDREIDRLFSFERK